MDNLRAKLMSRIQKRFEKSCSWQQCGSQCGQAVDDLSLNCRTYTMLFASCTGFQMRDNEVLYIIGIKH